MLLRVEGKGKQALPSGTGSPPPTVPRNTAEVEEKQPVSEHWSDSNQTNCCFSQNNDGFVRRLQQPNKSQLKNLPSSPNFSSLVPMTLRHHTKKEGNGSYTHKPILVNHVRQQRQASCHSEMTHHQSWPVCSCGSPAQELELPGQT